MGYVFNGDERDRSGIGYGNFPPAVGTHLLRGPHADLDGIDNDADGEVDEEGERLRMTNFMHHYNGGGVTEDPTTGIHYYNYMRGFWKDGVPLYYGLNGRDDTGVTTTYSFPGDPAMGEFWSEANFDGSGSNFSNGDRKFVLAAGPLRFEPGEETDLTIAHPWAQGENFLDSVTKLKSEAAAIKRAFNKGFWDGPSFIPSLPGSPGTPNLSAAVDQNFPNPFSEKTQIRFRLPDEAFVRIEILDVSGRHISTLVSEQKGEGTYAVEFDGAGLPSGVYFYRTEIGRAVQTKSMALFK